jgi:predicted dehydrogenase
LGKLKIGVIGLGVIGKLHIGNILKEELTELSAVCDISTEIASSIGTKHNCKWFTDPMKLLDARVCEAVLIATPHYDHTTVGIAAIKQGYHVLVEKPISVHKADCERLIAAHKNTRTSSQAANSARSSASVGSSPTGSGRPAIIHPARGGRRGKAKAAACCSISARTSST